MPHKPRPPAQTLSHDCDGLMGHANAPAHTIISSGQINASIRTKRHGRSKQHAIILIFSRARRKRLLSLTIMSDFSSHGGARAAPPNQAQDDLLAQRDKQAGKRERYDVSATERQRPRGCHLKRKFSMLCVDRARFSHDRESTPIARDFSTAPAMVLETRHP
jgi:hypothetical protein